MIKNNQITINIEDYPRLPLESNDSPRIQRCIDSITNPSKILFPLSNYFLKTQVNVNKSYIEIEGNGFNTIIESDEDISLFYVTKSYNRLHNFTIRTTHPNRSRYSIETLNATRPEIDRIYFDGIDSKSLSGVNMSGGSMGMIERCIFNHSSIQVDTWDVKIDKCWIWSISKDFGIKAHKGCGNLTITNTDVVPPFTTNSTRIGGIVLASANGVVSNVKIVNCYIDGNPIYETGKGIVITPNTFGVQIKSLLANKCNEDVVTIDSATSIDIDGQFFDNNATNLGGRDIVIKKSQGQMPTNINIDVSCIMNGSRTNAKPSIEVESGSNKSIIIKASIKQPTIGNTGAYADEEIKIDGVVTFNKCYGTRSSYFGRGQIDIPSGSNGVTISSLGGGVPFRIKPLSSQIIIGLENATLPPYRIQYTTNDQVYIAFSSAITTNTKLYWKVEL